MLIAFLLLVGGTLLLWGSAEALVRGAAAIGVRAGISAIVVGLTIVSLGTSAPELVVSLAAALEGRPSLALGNVAGSNLANIGLVLGLAALVRPMAMAPGVVRRDLPWMLAVTVLVFPLVLNLRLDRAEGAVLVLLLVAYLAALVRSGRRARFEEATDAGSGGAEPHGTASQEVPRKAGERFRAHLGPGALVASGALGLVVAARWIVDGAGTVGAELGISEMIVGLSVVAVGTSLPELATTAVATLRGKADLAVGNILGSNIFNLTFVLGGTALVRPLAIEPRFVGIEYPAVLALSLAVLPLVWTRGRVTRGEGALLLLLYGSAWVWIVLRQGAPT